MRIIAGTHRGTVLTDVGAGDTAAHLRPTSDRVRESLFNVLQGGRFGERVRGARVLDLFAGTGALGLEALSRGAAHTTFVDDGKVAGKLIAANIAKLRRAGDTTVLKADATKLPPISIPCTLVFLDPPYGKGLGLKAMVAALGAGWIAPNALIVLEENSAQPAPRGFRTLDSKRYGETWITLLEVSK
ncbi:MAG: 16S rRNA (guanine(966)-N(2))-methyltransferase RsmD [Planktotalea sp.]|uniref:16S rRNA (guanine(966)-N(2))-methyltransferase RsmD n=1 Tax=Planktotalea sp. TaxID=2029877 RepID=UPI00262B8DE1|nr:16S rRNA (guanine(966)-N(2))-methyltransferase RsmD [Planktotalea sp.]MDG1083616.1 16S rRNA (guanine(966)-N(2))-methyltransferase RsmD [Planktotalea sp.]